MDIHMVLNIKKLRSFVKLLKNLQIYAANTVCDLFCEAYVDYYEIDFGTGEKNEEFAAKLRGEFYWIIVNKYCFYKNQFAAGVSLDRFITLNKLDDIDVDSDDDVVSFIVGQIKEKCSQKGWFNHSF